MVIKIEEVEILINFNSLSMSSRKSIVGEVYWKVGDRFFPEEGWNDFVIVIMCWWLKTFKSVKNGQLKSKHEFVFMDGPLLVNSTKISDETLKLEFIKNKSNSQEILFTSVCNIKQLQKTLLHISNLLLNDLKIKKWQSLEIEELKKLKVLI